MEPTYFSNGSEFREWLERHHDTRPELVVGYHKRGSGKPSMTWQESVGEALCFGWIDGVRRGVDGQRYTIRFTPRRQGSIWSVANIERARRLIELGLMHPAGLRAFEARRDDRSAIYSYEQRKAAILDETYEQAFRRDETAWQFFQSCAPSYRKAAIHWVMSAKRDETRERRLARLIEDSSQGRTVPPLTHRTRKS